MSQLNRKSIRTRIQAHMCIAFVAVIVTAMVMVNFIMRHQIGVASADASSRAAASASNVVDNEISILKLEASLAGKDRGMRTLALNSEVDSKTVEDALASQNRSEFCDWYALTDGRGRVRGSNVRKISPGTNFATCKTVREALDGNSSAGIEQIGGRFAIVASTPIRSGEFVVATVATGKWFDSALALRAATSAGAAIAFTSKGGIITSSDARVAEVSDSAGPSRALIAGERFASSRFTLPMVYSATPISGVVLLKSDDVEKPFTILTRGLLILLGTSLMLLLVSSSAIAFSIARPLQRLAIAAQEMKSGHWPERQLIERDDEIGFLQQSFDEMAQSIREGNERLVAMLQIDPLTNLPNHRTFRESLGEIVPQAVASGREIAVVLFDLDGFEKFNQMQGPAIADGVLQTVAKIIQRNLEPGQLCGRHGGNEFAIVTDSVTSVALADAIRTQVHHETPVSTSVGIAHLNDQTQRVDLLLLAAEIAVSQAKEAGRNRVRTFTSFDFDGDEAEMHRFVNHSSYAAVKALAEAVDAKDEYTRGHSRRVSDYAVALARELGLDEGYVNLVHTSGTLHDVGKIGVPDVVLKKTERLSDEEFAMIKRHPELGEKIVAQIPQLRDTLPGIRHHHERWDGTGYPDGLAGAEIPLVARILAVADSYDAMTSDRSYRKGMAHEVAVEQIIKGAGKQFDPDLVFKFVGVLNLEISKAA